jgi:hypothetical protein
MLYSLFSQFHNATWRSVHNNGQYSLDFGEDILFLDVTNIKIHVINCPLNTRLHSWASYQSGIFRLGVRDMVINATFNTISAISCRTVLLVGQTRVSGENPRPAASHWQTLVLPPCIFGIKMQCGRDLLKANWAIFFCYVIAKTSLHFNDIMIIASAVH